MPLATWRGVYIVAVLVAPVTVPQVLLVGAGSKIIRVVVLVVAVTVVNQRPNR